MGYKIFSDQLAEGEEITEEGESELMTEGGRIEVHELYSLRDVLDH